MSKINVGVIGVGQMGTYHAQIYQKLPQVELCALCEFNDSRRKELETGFPGITLYKDYKELLKDTAIEALSIVLPDNLHREAVELAVQAGKHILLEKPLAKELEDGKALYEITKDYDKVFTTGFLLRFDPRFAMIKERLDSNELGDIIHCYVRRNSPIIGPRRYIGASDLSMHVMIHDIDYINWWMDCQPVKVFAKNRSVLLKENGMNDVIYALVTYVDSCDHGVRFVTGKGVQYPDSRHWYYVNGEVCGDLAEEVMAFVNNVATNTKSVITPKQSYDALRVVDAIERSIVEGKEVAL